MSSLDYILHFFIATHNQKFQNAEGSKITTAHVDQLELIF